MSWPCVMRRPAGGLAVGWKMMIARPSTLTRTVMAGRIVWQVLPTLVHLPSSKCSMRRLFAFAMALIVTLAVAQAAPKTDRAIIHVLNRVAFGPRPGDLDKVRAIGIDRYIEQQLHPERVADTGVDRRLAALTTIGMSSREIAERFEAPMLQARRARRAAAADSSAPSGVPSAAAGLAAPPGRDLQMEPANRVM
ncbi:MAG: hypothetical protein DMF97_10785, partial [Acidobacteria bacterium]